MYDRREERAGNLFIVLIDVESDETPHRRRTVEGVEKRPCVLQIVVKTLRSKEFEQTMSICASTQLRELESSRSCSTSPKFSEPPSVTTSTLAFAAASGRSSEVPMSSSRVVAELSFSLTRQARILRLKIVDDGLEVDSDAGCQPNHGCVDLPILVGACCSEAFLGLRRMHVPSGALPPALPDHLVPGACRGEEFAEALRVKR